MDASKEASRHSMGDEEVKLWLAYTDEQPTDLIIFLLLQNVIGDYADATIILLAGLLRVSCHRYSLLAS